MFADPKPLAIYPLRLYLTLPQMLSLTARRAKRSIKTASYAGLDAELSETEAPHSRKRQKRPPQDQAFSDEHESSESDIMEVTASGSPLSHSTTTHGVSRILPLIDRLLEWFDLVKHSREMPWRKDFDASLSPEAKSQHAYEVLVSEIMLQQTQVTTVKPYYNAWLKRFPTVRDLADVDDIEMVNALWKGLGYYSRASNLLKAAKKIVQEFDGKIPSDARIMEKEMPGVGRYTAGAVTSIAYNTQAPAIDGNVLRLFSRLLALHAPMKSKATLDVIWGAATNLVTQTSRPGDLNQAFIELGSTICKPSNPSCENCPLKTGCGAYSFMKQKDIPLVDLEDACSLCEPFLIEGNSVTRFPMKVVKKAPRKEYGLVTILQMRQDGEKVVLMTQRPAKGLLAGLWEFPTSDLNKEPKTSELLDASRGIVRDILPDLSEEDYHPVTIGSVLHLFSHIRKTYYATSVILQAERPSRKLPKDHKWIRIAEFSQMNVGKATEKLWKLRL